MFWLELLAHRMYLQYLTSFLELKIVVISFFQKGKFISLDLPFCFFVDFAIYVMEIEMLEPVVLARYRNNNHSPNTDKISKETN
jgi:hypothetical protein